MSSESSTPNPYASPETSNHIRELDALFMPLDFWRVFTVAVLSTLVVITPLLWLASKFLIIQWGVMIAATLIAFALQAIIIRWQRVIISPDLLRCGDFWGRSKTIAIHSIERVEPHGLPPFRFLRVYSRDLTRPLWLPLFVAHPQHFWGYVRSELPADSPLQTYAQQLDAT